MIKRCAFTFILIIFSVALLYYPVTAKEDTAQIKLKKTAVPAKKSYTYTVKRGDTISTIIRNIPGITEADLANNYQIIRKLNPDIKNINRLEIGQVIVLPGRPVTDGRETLTQIAGADATSRVEHKIYRIRKGDTLYKIIRREMKIPSSDIPQTLQTIKSLNPGIRNVNRIYAGAVIRLPGETVFVKQTEDIEPVAPERVLTVDRSVQPDKIIEVKEKKIMSHEARLAVLNQVMTQMNASVMTSGNYYLPIPNAGQVTIDCSKIPLVEFDDNTIVFVDLEDRAHGNLKKMISDNWNNYFLVKIDKQDDVIAVLRKVINNTKHYSMIKSEKSIVIGSVPPVEVIVDWIILKTAQRQPRPIQGIRSMDDGDFLLPKSVKNYAEANGFIITEISEETGIVGKPDELYALPPVPIFPITSPKELSYALLSHLALNARKDVEVQIFDTVKDGFNLAIKADVLVETEDTKYIIYTQNLSQQFINALKQAGHETVFVKEADPPKTIIEDVLRGLNIPFTSGSFTFSGLERNQAPYAIQFSGTKIYHNLYVVDFDMDEGLRGVLREIWSAEIMRYL